MFINVSIFLGIFITLIVLSIFYDNGFLYALRVASIIGIVITAIVVLIMGFVATKNILIEEIEPSSIVKSEYTVYFEFFDGDRKRDYDTKFMYEKADSIQFYKITEFTYFNIDHYIISYKEIYNDLPKDTLLIYKDYF